MASMLRSAASVTAVAEQLLGRLAALTGATACLVFPDREERRAIAYYYVLPSGPICWHPERLLPPPPLHSSAGGKCYLAGQSRLELESYIKGGLAAPTSNTITTRSRLLRELSDVRKRGYAVAYEEVAIGASALAVPVSDSSGAVVAGLVVVPVTENLTEAYVRRWLPELREAADRASSLLVGDWREELPRPD
jgi:DNA-binding IclR family transcriptional regulator